MDNALRLPSSDLSSLKERGRVKGVIRGFGGLVGVRDWPLLFAGSCRVRGEPLGRSRTGRGPAAGAAPEASLR